MDSPFEEAVHSALANAGYQVETQIGSGGFFIDLAVTDPDLPGRFLLGIECDGATYHSARSARDRDRLRQEVLEGLGWRIHRIWSTDWFRHPERELKRVITAIEEARIHFKTEQNKPILIDQLILPPEIKRVESQSVSLPINELYQIATLKINLGGKEFHTLPVALVASWVHEVVIVESPVHISEVVKRVCDALGIKRAGSRIQQVFEKAVNALPDITRKGDFLWTKQMEVPPVRNRSSLTINKKIDYIAPEEKEEAIFRVVHNSFGCDEESLMYAVCQGFGFNRLNEEMRIQFHEIINSMIESKRLTQKNGLVNIS